MCGIVGVFDMRGMREVDRSLLGRMNESQHHRGPDEGDIYTEPGVGFGHRRLSVIDLATGDARPADATATDSLLAVEGRDGQPGAPLSRTLARLPAWSLIARRYRRIEG